jgi:translocator protein
MPQNAWKKLGILIALCLLVQFSGAAFTFSSVNTWYPGLVKPSFNPPAWVFGPVWSVLYLSMVIAAWMVWISENPGTKSAMKIFLLQLFLNFLWSVFFFGFRNPGLAFAEIVVLWVMILATVLSFFKIRPAAGGILIPYLLWVSFAAVLNFTIWRLN